MEQITQKIVYFSYCGEINTQPVLQLARDRAQELAIRKVILASETGRSALEAVEIFRGSDLRLIVITHYPATTIGPKGKIPIGLRCPEYADRLATLIKQGVKIIQGTLPLAPPSRYIQWDAPTPESMLDKTLELFGAGTKIAIEASIMATDAGEVDEGEEIISCAGTYKGLDTALVVRATYSMNFFKEFEIHEFIARPRYRVRQLSECEFENWKGDLEKYYE
ncbi:MAG: hypothetical protein WAV05_09830 [Anaerolineales bacterium]